MEISALTPEQAEANGYIPIAKAIELKLTKLHRTTLFRQAKTGEIASCLVERGSKTDYWILPSALQKNAPIQKSKARYEELLKEWEFWVQHGEQNVCEETMKLMRRHLKRYWELLEEKPSIGGISAEGFRTALMGIKEDPENQKCRISKKRNIKTALVSFLKFLVSKGLRKKEEIFEIREIKLKAKYKPVREYMVELDVREALVFNRKWLNGRSQHDVISMELLIYLYAFAGMRRSEAANMQMGMIDFENELLTVRGKGGKERFVPLDPELAEKLKEWMQKHRPKYSSKWLLLQADGLKVTPASIGKRFLNFSNAWIKDQKRHGQHKTKTAKTHSLRRSYAVIWTMRGKPLAYIQDDLGHTDIRITRLYVPTGALESQNFNKQYFSQQQGQTIVNQPQIQPIPVPISLSYQDMKKAAILSMLAQSS